MERPDRAAIGTFLVASLGASGAEQALDAEVAHHLRVRRVAPGAGLRLTDGRGKVADVTLAELTRRDGRVTIDRVVAVPAPEPLHLLAPVADRDRTLWLAEKATELGITRWTPVRWQRSRGVASRGEGDAFRTRLRGRMAAALEQSGGSWMPLVDEEIEPRDVARAAAAPPSAACVALDAVGEPVLAVVPADGAVVIAIGPEGGFEPAELDLLRDTGFRGASLGRATLRFETAGVAALTIVVARRTAGARGVALR